MKSKILALGLLVCGLGWAQQRNTVFLDLTPVPLTSAPTTAFIVNNNIGQGFHTFTAMLTGGNGCASQEFRSKFAAFIQISYNGQDWALGPQFANWNTDGIDGTETKFYRLSGSYPYVRLKVLSFPNSLSGGCHVKIFYTGSLEGDSPTQYNFYFFTNVTTLSDTTSCVPLLDLVTDNTTKVVVRLQGLIVNGASGVSMNVFTDSACKNSVGQFSTGFVLQPSQIGIYGNNVQPSGHLGFYARGNQNFPINVFSYIGLAN